MGGRGLQGEASPFPGVREALEAGIFLTGRGAGRPGLQGEPTLGRKQHQSGAVSQLG